MPRHRRLLLDGYAYHVLDRGNRKHTIFHKPEDWIEHVRKSKKGDRRLEVPVPPLEHQFP